MRKTTFRSMTAVLGLAVALSLTGCGSDDPPAAGESTQLTATAPGTPSDVTGTGSPAQVTGDDSPGEAPAAGRTATALQAIATAAASAGGTAYEIDDQDDDGTWEVDVAVGDQSVEVTVSADGQTVTGTENDDLDDDDRAGLNAATITLTDAINIAIAEVGGVLDDAELDEDDGVHYWEVSVDETDGGDDDVDVKVNVATGAIIEIDR